MAVAGRALEPAVIRRVLDWAWAPFHDPEYVHRDWLIGGKLDRSLTRRVRG